MSENKKNHYLCNGILSSDTNTKSAHHEIFPFPPPHSRPGARSAGSHPCHQPQRGRTQGPASWTGRQNAAPRLADCRRCRRTGCYADRIPHPRGLFARTACPRSGRPLGCHRRESAEPVGRLSRHATPSQPASLLESAGDLRKDQGKEDCHGAEPVVGRLIVGRRFVDRRQLARQLDWPRLCHAVGCRGRALTPLCPLLPHYLRDEGQASASRHAPHRRPRPLRSLRQWSSRR